MEAHFSEPYTFVVEEVLGFTKRKNADWFDENIGQIQGLLQEKYKLHAAFRNNPLSIRQRELRAMENEWWIRRCWGPAELLL